MRAEKASPPTCHQIFGARVITCRHHVASWDPRCAFWVVTAPRSEVKVVLPVQATRGGGSDAQLSESPWSAVSHRQIGVNSWWSLSVKKQYKSMGWGNFS
jgi:hypothetical protein